MRDASLKDFVLDQLSGLPGVRARGMFGGWGLYLGEEFFGMVYRGSLYLRTDDATRPAYRDMGSRPIPFGDDVENNLYWQVPADVLEEASLLCDWARAAAATPRGTRKGRRAGR